MKAMHAAQSPAPLVASESFRLRTSRAITADDKAFRQLCFGHPDSRTRLLVHKRRAVHSNGRFIDVADRTRLLPLLALSLQHDKDPQLLDLYLKHSNTDADDARWRLLN